MASIFQPGWMNCLDELMMVMTSLTCPGCMMVPPTPYPFGLWESMANHLCALSCILFCFELDKGKDIPLD
jgi:hypothetical protein